MRIGVLCSGGDAPGMNACVRAVVRRGILGGHEVIGIRRGYQGLLESDLHVRPDGRREMTLGSVADIIQQGGTIPWWLAEIAYGYYSNRYGREQSLERLRERGGFGREELVHLLRREEGSWETEE